MASPLTFTPNNADPPNEVVYSYVIPTNPACADIGTMRTANAIARFRLHLFPQVGRQPKGFPFEQSTKDLKALVTGPLSGELQKDNINTQAIVSQIIGVASSE